MHILALNCGSSSIKAALIEATSGKRLHELRIEEIGTERASMTIDATARAIPARLDFSGAVTTLLEAAAEFDVPLDAIVHRVVHGGPKFEQPVLIDTDVLAEIDALSPLAPLHNPPAVITIRHSREMYPNVPQWAVFDTAFHATLPPCAREYALPRNVAGHLRRYGFHGISHAHVSRIVSAHLPIPFAEQRLISCHLGNGASIAAIKGGCSVDTSMGMTPLEGLVMGTRAGDLDPGMLLELLRTRPFDEVETLLTRGAGLKGLTGTNDMREIDRRAQTGDEDCALAITLYAYRLRKYIGAYAAAMGGVDAIAFTGGIGENSPTVRSRCLAELGFLGVRLDSACNGSPVEAPCVQISAADSRVAVFIVPANEELAMADEVARIARS